MTDGYRGPTRWFTMPDDPMHSGTLTTTGAILAALAMAELLLSGPSVRFGWWHYRIGLMLFAVALLFGIAAILLLGIALMRGERIDATWIVAAVLALIAVALPARGIAKVRSVPAIHDITTDPGDPPAFSAIAPRANRPSEETIAAQREAYPDIEPIRLPLPADQAFARARAAAEALGWEIVSASPEAGAIEATDTTFWFGFQDDVAIRVRPEDTGSRIDVRSVSRVGQSDVGANAERIRRFRDALR